MKHDSPTLRGKRVLICEDEGLIMMQWKKLLSMHGASVVGFTPSGEECVETALKERPDIVLVDVGLTGMDGWEASSRILKQWDTCIVMVTGQPEREVATRIKSIPVSGYIKKPSTGQDFINEITRYYARYDSKATDETHEPYEEA